MALTNQYMGSGGNIVDINEANRVINWYERTDENPEDFHLNAGTYLMKKDILKLLPDKNKFSLEKDLFPTIFKRECYGFRTDELFIDIGIPERYKKALEILPSLADSI